MEMNQPVPELPVSDVEKAQQYYHKYFGCKIEWIYPGEEIGAVSNGDMALFFRKRVDEFQPVVLWVYCNDVDDTFRVLNEHGANIVVHSITKWIGGHGVAIGGCIFDGGNFDWGNGRHSEMTEPYAPFHGMKFWEEFGPTAFVMKIRSEAMRDLGAALSPHNAFLILQGVETLELRMKQHIANTAALRDWLLEQDAVTWVRHPEMNAPPHVADMFPKGAGSMLCFGVAGGREGGAAFINSVNLATHLANVGDSRTLVLHPGSTTHSRLTKEAMEAAGISEDLIRVSVGLEDIKDITNDFAKGLRAAAKAAK